MRSNHNHYTHTPNSATNLLFILILSVGIIFGTYITTKDDDKNTTILVKVLMNTLHDQDSTINLLKDSLHRISMRHIDVDTVYIPIKIKKIIKQDTTAVVKDTVLL